jgi:hypothetical protein
MLPLVQPANHVFYLNRTALPRLFKSRAFREIANCAARWFCGGGCFNEVFEFGDQRTMTIRFYGHGFTRPFLKDCFSLT